MKIHSKFRQWGIGRIGGIGWLGKILAKMVVVAETAD